MQLKAGAKIPEFEIGLLDAHFSASIRISGMEG
jgi:hypothetical protein